tara:strand:- start:2011 stop:2991 length:981 start_codon:yes stop_codon:yes gene_type:complete
MQSLAQAIQSQGRGNDTMLVHMTPREVGGLQNLANKFGGSLTTNPSTGLPEAGFLDSILPAVAGAALTIGSGGLINPLTAGAIVGGGTTLVTGDVGKGLTAGLGAFGGGSLGTLSGAGAGASTLGKETATHLVTSGPSFANLAAAPTGKLATAGLAAASPALAQATEQPNLAGSMGSPTMIRPFSFDPGKTTADRTADLAYDRGEKTYFRPTFSALEPFEAKEGGIVNLNVGGMPGMASPTPPSRFLRGAGDGVSDSIPATVNQGERPAALSDGEYVIDARGVAEIGNGSSEAGAKKLTEMMNRIHSARRKADKGEDMNADRFLLA